MSKRKLARIAALASTALVGAALIGSVVATTGAYFTDSHGGQIAGTNGTVAISVTGSGSTSAGDPGLVQFDFSGILPGAPGKTATVNVTNPTGNSEDVWLVFDNSNFMWSAVNDLGQFGMFQVGGYTYDNLSNKYAVGTTPGVAGTAISGSFMTFSSCTTVPRVQINYLPHAILIGTLAGGGSTSFPITFQYNACMTEHQGELLFNPAGADSPINTLAAPGGPLKFNVVAFQGGVDPTSPFNGANAISALNLTSAGSFQNQYIQFSFAHILAQ